MGAAIYGHHATPNAEGAGVNGYTVEVGPRDVVFKRRVFIGRGAALADGIEWGAKTARRMSEKRFYVTDSVSARTDVYRLSGDSWRRVFNLEGGI